MDKLMSIVGLSVLLISIAVVSIGAIGKNNTKEKTECELVGGIYIHQQQICVDKSAIIELKLKKNH